MVGTETKTPLIMCELSLFGIAGRARPWDGTHASHGAAQGPRHHARDGQRVDAALCPGHGDLDQRGSGDAGGRNRGLRGRHSRLRWVLVVEWATAESKYDGMQSRERQRSAPVTMDLVEPGIRAGQRSKRGELAIHETSRRSALRLRDHASRVEGMTLLVPECTRKQND